MMSVIELYKILILIIFFIRMKSNKINESIGNHDNIIIIIITGTTILIYNYYFYYYYYHCYCYFFCCYFIIIIVVIIGIPLIYILNLDRSTG